MKKLLIIIVVLFLQFQLFSQTIVSTSPEDKNAIFEEFTGENCGFCPYGHKAVEEFIQLNPNDAFAIAMHQGAFAVPEPWQPDYQTTYGDELGAYFGPVGWPQALINRTDFGDGYLYFYPDWQSKASIILTESAYVNIACEADIDVQTREMTVHVETYYTASSPFSTNKINVALNQNNVKGPQYSSWFNPDMITPDGQYLHQHMLREYLTGTWGEDINTTTAGSFIDNYYNYTIPADLKDVPLWLGNLEIVSYISESQTEIINVHGCIPALTNFEYAYDAGIFELDIPAASCSNVYSLITAWNNGSEDIHSIDFEVIINGVPSLTYSWSGDTLKPFTAVEIEIPNADYSSTPTNIYEINITAVNGQNDENPDNNHAQSDFDNAGEFEIPVILNLNLGGVAFGTSWRLLDDQNNVIQQGDGYENNSVHTIELDADAGCYKFIMMDSDGFFYGNYSLTDGNGTVIVQNDQFGNKEVTAFTLPIYQPVAEISSNTSIICNGGTVEFYDASLGGPSSWDWTFEGGDPPTSNEKNPLVNYINPGDYDVSLTVSNALGTDQITIQDYITVSSMAYGNLALDFDGLNDYVELSDESVFDFTDAITIEAWIKTNSVSGTQGVVSKNYGSNCHPYQIRLIDDEIIFGFYSTTIGWQPIQTSGADLQTGVWTHIAVTYDRTSARIYVDGVQKGIGYKSFEIPLNDQPVEIGRTKDVAFEYFNGEIDEVRIWDIARTENEISDNICTNFIGSTDPNLVALYKFNECGGTLLTDVKNNHNGTLINMNGDEWMESDACPSYTITFNVSEQPGSYPVEDAGVNMNGILRFTDEFGQAIFEGNEPGTYTYIVSKDGYLNAEGQEELIDQNLTINIDFIYTLINEWSDHEIVVYPNPAKGQLYIRINDNEEIINVRLINSIGKSVYKDQFKNSRNISIDLNDLQAGIYMIQIQSESKQYKSVISIIK